MDMGNVPILGVALLLLLLLVRGLLVVLVVPILVLAILVVAILGGLPVGLLLVVLLLLLVLPAPASPTTHIMCTTPLVAPAPACLVPNLGIRGGGRAGVGCLGVRALLGSRWLPLRREGDPANSISIKHVIQNATEA